MRRRLAELLAHVEDPGVPDPVHPSPAGHERRLMHVARQHQRREELGDPVAQLLVAVGPPPAPADRAVARRRVMDPYPVPRAPGGIPRHLRGDRRAGLGALPPGKAGEQRPADGDGLAVAHHARDPQPGQPAGDPLASRPFDVEIVIAGADEDPRHLGEPAQILGDHDDLRVLRHDAGDLQQIAGDHHGVVIRRNRQDPVELLQRIVQVGDQQKVHAGVRSVAGSAREPRRSSTSGKGEIPGSRSPGMACQPRRRDFGVAARPMRAAARRRCP